MTLGYERSAGEEHDGGGVEEGAGGGQRRLESFQSRLFRLVQAKNLTTTQERGSSANPT